MSQTHRPPTAWEFNQEIIFGEIGALMGAYAAAWIAAAVTRRPALISGALIPGTLAGGTIFWLAARIRHQQERRGWSMRVLARDVGYFTPAAAILGLAVYDPVIFLASHFVLARHGPVTLAVIVGEVSAFAIFLACMNGYRLILARTGARHL